MTVDGQEYRAPKILIAKARNLVGRFLVVNMRLIPMAFCLVEEVPKEMIVLGAGLHCGRT